MDRFRGGCTGKNHGRGAAGLRSFCRHRVWPAARQYCLIDSLLQLLCVVGVLPGGLAFDASMRACIAGTLRKRLKHHRNPSVRPCARSRDALHCSLRDTWSTHAHLHCEVADIGPASALCKSSNLKPATGQRKDVHQLLRLLNLAGTCARDARQDFHVMYLKRFMRKRT